MRRANAAVAAAGKANTRAMACGCMLSCGKSAVETVEADMPSWNQQEINNRCGYDLGDLLHFTVFESYTGRKFRGGPVKTRGKV